MLTERPLAITSSIEASPGLVARATAKSSISSARCPPRIDSRERKSTHTLWPSALSRCRGPSLFVAISAVLLWSLIGAEQRSRARGDVLWAEAELLEHGGTRG